MVIFMVSLDCLWEMKSCAKGQVNPKLKFRVMSPSCIHNPAYYLLHHYKAFSRIRQPTAVLCIPLIQYGLSKFCSEGQISSTQFWKFCSGSSHHSCLWGDQTLGYRGLELSAANSQACLSQVFKFTFKCSVLYNDVSKLQSMLLLRKQRATLQFLRSYHCNYLLCHSWTVFS